MKVIFLNALLICCVITPYAAQAQSSLKSNTELQKIDEIINRAETYFHEGEILLRHRNATLAREKFDKATETILLSGLSVRDYPKLQKYYTELVERIYKIENPDSKVNISENNKLSATVEPKQSEPPQIGFAEQKFEPSPLDELAKLELNTEETPPVREIRKIVTQEEENKLLGNKPAQLANGKVQIVTNWLQEYLNDPYSMKIVRWSKVEKEYVNGEPFWVVKVRFRAKNGFGAYILNDYVFFIRRNKIVRFVS
jgi:hypothetical protein